ncbi:hypothetical protein [Azorhizobium caulinodans]|nr:hypothetical protein [Azorhizobium caulinodans]
MRLTQTLITEDEARRRAPDLVAVIEEEVVALLEALGDLEAELVAERTKATEALALVETLRLPKVE